MDISHNIYGHLFQLHPTLHKCIPFTGGSANSLVTAVPFNIQELLNLWVNLVKENKFVNGQNQCKQFH